MEPLLIVVTVVALGLATAMTFVAWGLWREERRRSDARIAWLRARAAGVDRDSGASRAGPPAEPVAAAAVAVRAPVGATPGTAQSDSAGRAPARPVPAVILNTAPLPRTPDHRAVLAVAAVAVAGVALAVLWRVGTAGAAGAPGPRAAPPNTPLMLLSLEHTADGDTLTVSGVAANPVSGAILDDVWVVVSAVDDTGAPAGSARAPLVRGPLMPGARAPFAVTLAGARAAARYRVGFRGSDGRIIGHVDRRAGPAVASEGIRP